VGATIDSSNANFLRVIDDLELCTVWINPAFGPGVAALPT